MQREPYHVSPADRIKEILGVDEIPSTAILNYSFDEGYEKLTYRSASTNGTLHFAGSYHPNATCEGGGICIYCGRTL